MICSAKNIKIDNNKLIIQQHPIFDYEKNYDLFINDQKTISFKTADFTSKGVISNNKRLIYRHPSDKGIVIEYFVDDEYHQLFVYDEFVTGIPMLKNDIDTSIDSLLTEYITRQVDQAPPGGIYGTSNITLNRARTLYGIGIENFNPGISSVSNNTNGIDTNLYNISNNTSSNEYLANSYKSSHELNDLWLELNNESQETPLINYARSIVNIDGIDHLDVPTIRELSVILTEFNNSDPKLSKTKDKSFFENKLNHKYMTCNLGWLRSGRISEVFGAIWEVKLLFSDGYILDTETGVANLFNFDQYYKLGQNANQPTTPEYISLIGTDVGSFLVRDITNI